MALVAAPIFLNRTGILGDLANVLLSYKLDTLAVSFSLGHKPTGSRDPYGLRRAAIGLCRLAVEGGLTVARAIIDLLVERSAAAET